MSTTTQNPGRNLQGETEELDSFFSASRKQAFASATINANTRAQTFITDDVKPTFNDPLLRQNTLDTQYVPKSQFIEAKRSARDAWFAVAILATFIAGGIYYIVQRVGSDADKIDTLTVRVDDLGKQLTGERGVVSARNKEIRLLNEQICELKHTVATVKTAQR
jgi:hypothetical protein